MTRSKYDSLCIYPNETDRQVSRMPYTSTRTTQSDRSRHCEGGHLSD